MQKKKPFLHVAMLAFAIALLIGVFGNHKAVAAGSGTSGDPFTSAADAYTVTSGRYFFNLGNGTFQADVDNSEGGGWILILQYVHQGGTTPALDVIAAGSDMPVTSTAVLGADESADTSRWGHAGNAAMSQFTGDIELRWFGQTSGHNRIVHFRSTIGDDYVRTGSGRFEAINADFTALTGHSAITPGGVNNAFSDRGDLALTNFPFFRNAANHWGIAANTTSVSNRWEVDDFPNGPQNNTIHRIWVRASAPLAVTNTNNAGAGSLRNAITIANANPDLDDISFDIPGTGPFTISLTSALPPITDDGVTINGTTQTGASCGNLWAGTPHNLLVRLDGGNRSFSGLNIAASNVAIRGLSLTGFRVAILDSASASNSRITCNYLGLDVAGAVAGNTRGINAQGSAAIIGGLDSDAGNVVSGNDSGIESNGTTTGLAVRGNFIGTDPTGLLARPNTSFTVSNTRGNSTWSDLTRNLISGNGSHGFDLQLDDNITGSAGDFVIAGNYVGVDRTGNSALPNGGDGFRFVNGSVSGVRFGGTSAADRNIISGNTGAAINIAANNDISILGNYIGVGADGSSAIGNGLSGIFLNGTTDITIGDGTSAGGNIIANNTNFGINIAGNSLATIIGNSIYDNGDLGINNGGGTQDSFSVTANDAGDADSGANNLLNYPEFQSLSGFGTNELSYSFTLDVPANADGYRIEFFKNSAADASGFGEGETFIGALDIAHDGSGPLSFSGSLTASQPISVGDLISATATRKTATGFAETSEFSETITVVSPLVVTNTNNAGAGSLRNAITIANANPDLDDISFDIPGTGPHRIAPVTPLPTITDAGITIDGLTQSGATCGQLTTGTQHNLLIELFGSLTGSGTALNVRADGFTVKGLSIIGFPQDAIDIRDQSNALIECNYIGVEPNGTTKSPNSVQSDFFAPVRLQQAVNPIIRNNLISGNDDDTNDSGIRLFTVTGGSVTGNIIGLDATGSSILGNANLGIGLDDNTSGTIIGGTTASERNIISGNGGRGIFLESASSNITILGNYIGVATDGNTARRNNNRGIDITDVSNISIGDGTSAGRNIISGNGQDGIFAVNTVNLSINGNYIGVGADGSTTLGNTRDGIVLQSRSIQSGHANALITNNVIAANGQSGIDISSFTLGDLGATSNIIVTANKIGVAADGVTPAGNVDFGVKNTNVPGSIIVGGTNPADGNIIAYNQGAGAVVDSRTGANMVIIGNSIFSNGGIGIDINRDGITANDAGDADSGANELLNFPVINSLSAEGLNVSFDINLDAPASAQGYRIEFFRNNTADASGFGEGEVYLGFADISHAGGDINHVGTFTASSAVPQGSIISATATRKTATGFDITSEFSLNFTSVAATQLSVTKTVEVYDPLNEGLYAVPGNDIIASQTVTNIGEGAVDIDSIIMISAIAEELIFFNGDIDDGGPANGPIAFNQSAGTGLSFDAANDVAFSNSPTKPANMAACNYLPGTGYDPAVTFICINPKGIMAAGDPDPNFTVQYRAMIE